MNRKQVVPHTYIFEICKLIVFYDFFIFINWQANFFEYNLTVIRSTITVLSLINIFETYIMNSIIGEILIVITATSGDA